MTSDVDLQCDISQVQLVVILRSPVQCDLTLQHSVPDTVFTRTATSAAERWFVVTMKWPPLTLQSEKPRCVLLFICIFLTVSHFSVFTC